MSREPNQAHREVNPSSGGDASAALKSHLPWLGDIQPASEEAAAQKTAETLAIVVGVLKRIEQTIHSQLEVLSKNHPPIKSMAETVQNQGLLDIENVLRSVLGSDSSRMNRLSNYGDLLLRWSSAMMAGVQTTILELPNELDQALNPDDWNVEKKRWSAEAEAFWNHYKFVIRHDLPLTLGDRMKEIQAQKTLDAYALLSSEKSTEPPKDSTAPG
ncbi:MAG: hypothetical protein IIB58_07570 [Planctomycetes bacterium]|nr:hypothetical protein [Planctomycetota bacterium]